MNLKNDEKFDSGHTFESESSTSLIYWYLKKIKWAETNRAKNKLYLKLLVVFDRISNDIFNSIFFTNADLLSHIYIYTILAGYFTINIHKIKDIICELINKKSPLWIQKSERLAIVPRWYEYKVNALNENTAKYGRGEYSK